MKAIPKSLLFDIHIKQSLEWFYDFNTQENITEMDTRIQFIINNRKNPLISDFDLLLGKKKLNNLDQIYGWNENRGSTILSLW